MFSFLKHNKKSDNTEDSHELDHHSDTILENQLLVIEIVSTLGLL